MSARKHMSEYAPIFGKDRPLCGAVASVAAMTRVSSDVNCAACRAALAVQPTETKEQP